MLLKIDENLPVSLAAVLRGIGHDAHHVEDEQLSKQPDTVVAAAAKAENRILITLDVEFADIRKYAPGTHPGVVLVRTPISGAPAINQFILDFITLVTEADIAGAVTVVEPGRLRIRRA